MRSPQSPRELAAVPLLLRSRAEGHLEGVASVSDSDSKVWRRPRHKAMNTSTARIALGFEAHDGLRVVVAGATACARLDGGGSSEGSSVKRRCGRE